MTAPALKQRARLVAGICVSAWVLMLGGCATYHSLPLSKQAKLADRITGIRHILPKHEAGSGSKVINVDDPLVPDQIGLLAVLNDPGLQSERGEYKLAQAALIQSALLPNPSVSLGYAGLLGGPGVAAAYSASVAQDITSLITYRSRVAAATAQVSKVNADLLWKEWQVAQKARLLAIDIYWDGRAIAASHAGLVAISRTMAKVRGAISDGAMDLPSLTPLVSSRSSIEQSLAALRLKQMKDWAAMDALLGLKPDVRFLIATPHPAALPQDLRALINGMPARRPDLVALRLGYRSADEEVRAAILGQFPAFILGGTWGSDTSRVRTAGPTVTFDLPIFNRNQGGVAHARATRLLLHEQYQSRLDDAVSSILALQARGQRISEFLARTQRGAITAGQRAKAARQAYKHNNLDERALVDYETGALQQQLDVFDLERGLDETRVALGLELGLGLPQARIAPLDPARPQ